MDPKTFEYNIAIQQITAQEQGDAQHLIGIIKECYFLNKNFIVWGLDWRIFMFYNCCRYLFVYMGYYFELNL